VLTRSLEVIPAVDVLEGRAVRLREGRREAVTLEGGDPLELVRQLAGEGAKRIHVVDLDGAFAGTPSVGLLERLCGVGVPIQVGGGLRSSAAVSRALMAGADRVMVGTAALRPGFLSKAVALAGDRLVVAIDVRDDRVSVGGWTEATEVTPRQLARRCVQEGVARVLVTSTTRDGSLNGPDVGLLEEVMDEGPPVMAAGGIGSLDDLRALRDIGCEAAVVGSALLAGRFTLPEALGAVSGR
jgi:phosphoribosylformimino-5-aminoimidazole carboxamide ribotide isomerase